MGATTVRCYVLGGDVSVVSEFDGTVVNVICPEFNRITYNCNRKTGGAGFLGQVFGRVADRTTGTKAVACEFIDPGGSPCARIADALE